MTRCRMLPIQGISESFRAESSLCHIFQRSTGEGRASLTQPGPDHPGSGDRMWSRLGSPVASQADRGAIGSTKEVMAHAVHKGGCPPDTPKGIRRATEEG